MVLTTSAASEVADNVFDFVIIGGGLSGCVLARRLSDANFSVAVIEAGKAHGDDPRILNPLDWSSLHHNPEYDWGFKTVPQVHAKNLAVDWNRGKGLGGSSCINLLVWTRPTREELDAIERLGNPGWNWDELIKYSRKAERLCVPEPEYDNELKNLYGSHSLGHDGVIPVSFSRTGCNVEHLFQKAFEANGVPISPDVFDGEVFGVFKNPSDIDSANGTRVSAAVGYLHPILGRPNLKVLTEARASKLITKKDGGELLVSGVEFIHAGTTYNVWAKREVLLCAGTLQSPQILELSGIGDPAVLGPLGITVALDLPTVGTNVQDHILAGVLYRMVEDKDIVTRSMLKDPAVDAQFRKRYPHLPHPWLLSVQSMALFPIHSASEDPAKIVAARQKIVEENADKYPPGLLEQYKLQLEHLADKRQPDLEVLLYPFSARLPPFPDPTKPFLAAAVELTKAWARGTIHIRSANPEDDPLIDPHYLDNETDLDVLVEGWKFMRKVCDTEPFKSLVIEELGPGPAVQTDEQIRDMIQQTIETSWHACGSCSMLPRDKGGVVDPELRVYGTKHLRVVDLSILPLEVSSHTQSVVYGIAERAADIIKSAHNV